MDNIHTASSEHNGHSFTEQPNPTNKTSPKNDLDLSESDYERLNHLKDFISLIRPVSFGV